MMWRWWTCRRLRGRLVDLASGSLPAAEQTPVEVHVAGCARCRDALAALREVPALLEDESDIGEEFWREQRQAIMRTVRDLPPPERTRRWWLPVDRVPSAARRPWVTWAPALVAVTAVLAMVTLRPEMPWRTPETPAQVDRLDDPALLSLSDLAGDSDTDPGLGVDVVSNDQPLPELSDEELDALSQLVGGHGR